MLKAIFESLGLIGNAIILLVGMLTLDKSSDLTIDNSVRVAEVTGLGKTTIGFLLIASFTTLPELSVSIFSTMDPEAIGIAIGNVLGSNIVNVCLILGLCILILSLRSRGGTYRFSNATTREVKDLYFGLFTASLIPLALIYIGYASSIIGAILITVFVFHNIQMIRSRRSREAYSSGEKGEVARHILLTLLGVAGVVASAYFIVESASYIAGELGVPRVVIGATIVAFGTSLPELANGINATRKGHIELVLGNIVGSGFVNITLILGVALIGGPFRVSMAAYSSLVIFSIMANLLLWYFLSGERIGWREGVILLFMYALFIVTSFGAQQP
ncbi:MAG: sodium:calcium antiporter [Candidatus Bathyarchaeota archaeon]|nr:sodium:calcium antiporter [Candidatus Bathyarchaeota archaeon]